VFSMIFNGGKVSIEYQGSTSIIFIFYSPGMVEDTDYSNSADLIKKCITFISIQICMK